MRIPIDKIIRMHHVCSCTKMMLTTWDGENTGTGILTCIFNHKFDSGVVLIFVELILIEYCKTKG